MANCIVIPVEIKQPLVRAQLDSLSDLQHAVGGWIESVSIHENFGLIVNEEGRVRRLPINRRATLLLRLFVRAARNAPAIVGDVVLVGPPTEELFADLPGEFEQLLLETRQYVVLARTNDKQWRSQPFDSYWEASEVAIVADLMEVLGDIAVIAQE